MVIDQQRALFDIIDRQRQTYIGTLQTLVRLGREGEAATQQYVANQLKALGGQVESIIHPPARLGPDHELGDPTVVTPVERTSVVGQWSGTGGGRSLLLFAHPDSEPVTGIEWWEHDPFAAEVEEGRLYGWGVADDLLGIAVMLAAIKALSAVGSSPAGSLILASTPSKHHAQGILAVLERGYRADGAIYLHPAESGAGLKDIKAMTLGLLQFKIVIPGRSPDTREPVHTPFYHTAVNPIDKAWLIYQALQDLATERAENIHHPLLMAAVGRATNLQLSYLSCGHEQDLHRVSDEAVLGGSITFPPAEKMGDVQAQISAVVDAATQADLWLSQHPPRVEWLMGTSGVELSTDSPLYQIVHQTIGSVTGLEPASHPLHTASDIRHPLLYGEIPTVGFGSLAGNFTQAGSRDEWVDVEDYISMVKVVVSIILDWCGA